MAKRKGKKKTDDLKVFEATYLAAINRNQELVTENNLLTDEVNKLRNSVVSGYYIRLKMYMDHEVKIWDFTDLLKMIQFESPALLVKMLRRVHHNYSVLNIREMTEALNSNKLFVSKWDEGVTNELYVLKTLADCIEAIKEVH